MLKRLFIFIILCFSLSSCFTSQYYTREPALVKGIDMEQSLKIAEDQMKKGGIDQALSIWVLRDQFVTPQQAKTIGDLYLANIDSIKSEFAIWHNSWAISNLYRWGTDSIKTVLEVAYQKAKTQPNRIKGWQKGAANSHINGNKITSGFIHMGGRYYAHGHLVVPGNKKYLQSYEEYLEKEDKSSKKK